jgi:FHA domain
MPRLFVKTGCQDAHFELRLGANRIGRRPGNHLQIDEPSVSGAHCELVLGAEVMIVTDLGSSNGTFIDGVLVREGFLFPGQTLTLGQVDLEVEAPLRLANSALTPWHRMNAVRESFEGPCVYHAYTAAIFFCPNCQRRLCWRCVQGVRQLHGLRVHLCRSCGIPCQSIAVPRSPVSAQLNEPSTGVSTGQTEFREELRAFLLPQLAAWLKQKFLQVLLQQRSGLIATQEAATEQMQVFERRLAQIQEQMAERASAYERRIKDLETELANSAEQNRVLIRHQIDLMRLEMQKQSSLLTTD